MNPLFAFYWPSIAAGAVIGAVISTIVFRREFAGARRLAWLGGGIALALAGAMLWSGPLGGARALVQRVEGDARLTLDNYEMTQVQARLARSPLSRELLLTGPADDFQTSELVRIMGSLPAVSKARWQREPSLPLAAEGALAAIAGFLLGLFLAYLLELHRRYNAQWDW